ncbi:MAG TPA: hypothetical protein VFB62_04755 [Polyangiaceae bacterium]|nr:hypothetical protein [Polyangiaceae bacterium]
MRAFFHWAAAFLAVGLVSHCATQGDDPGAAATTLNWSSSSSAGGSMGGSAGMHGTGATGGGSGGGATTASTGGSGSGGAPQGVIVLLARGASQAFAGAYHEGQGWVTANLAGGGLDRPAVALLADGTAVGLLRGANDQLRFTVWNQTSWSNLADVGPQITTRASPALDAGHALYHGDNYMHYYAAYATQWSPSSEAVAPPNQPQSFGPSSAALAALGNEVVAAFAGSDTLLYVQTRANATWSTAVPVTASKIAQTPAIAALSSGPELMIVYAHHEANQFDDKKLFFTTRTNGIWSSPLKIDDNVFTDEPVRLTALAQGGALVTYRGTDGKGYWLRYDATLSSWSPPDAIANPNPNITSAPDVTIGIGTTEAELVFIDAQDTTAYHTRLSATWSVPTVIGGTGLAAVAVDSAP